MGHYYAAVENDDLSDGSRLGHRRFLTGSPHRRPRWSLPAINSLFAATLLLVCVLRAVRRDLLAFSLTFAFPLVLVAVLSMAASLIVRSTDRGVASSLPAFGSAAFAAGAMTAAAGLVYRLPPDVVWIGERAGVVGLTWMIAAWVSGLLGAPVIASTIGTEAPPEPQARPRWTLLLSGVTGLVLLLAAAQAILGLRDWRLLAEAVLVGPGLYHLLLAGGCALACWRGVALERRGLAAQVPPVTNLQRDRLLIERWGGRVLAASGLGASLVSLQAAQSTLVDTGGAVATASKPIGPFDLLTWLGTLGTLVVVVAGALVAMYVKRRDDETQHMSAVTAMRQEWINRSRDLLSELIALGEHMRAKIDAGDFEPGLAVEAQARLRAMELQLNPVETMPRVLLTALRSWLLEAGLHEHGQANATKRTSALTDFEATTAWIVALAQLVIKTEWAVTSVGRDRVIEKLGETWRGLINYEQTHREEIGRIAPSALRLRETAAPFISTLVSAAGPDVTRTVPA